MATSVAKRSPAKHAATPSAEIIPSAIRVRQMGIRYSRGKLPMTENRRVCTFPILLKSRYIIRRGQSRANSSLRPSIRSSVARRRGPKRSSTQCLTSQFPTHPNREFFEALQGIKSGDRGMFSLIRESALVRFFGICFADKCDRPDRPRLCREGEEAAARMLEAAEADLA